MSNLSKAELVSAVAESTEYTKKDIAAVIDALMEAITKAVANGEKVTLFGFGTFVAKKRNARVGHNPQTGEKVTIPERTVPTFSASKTFKEIVNK